MVYCIGINPTWDLALSIPKYHFKYQELIEFNQSTNLSFKGNLQKHHVGGQVMVENLLLKPDQLELGQASLAARDPNLDLVENLKSWEDYDKKDIEEKGETPDILKTAIVDLDIKMGHNNWMRHPMVQGEIAWSFKSGERTWSS